MDEKNLSPLFTDEVLAITINPADERQYYGKSNRWGKAQSMLSSVLLDLLASGTIYIIYLYPDLSAPSPIIPPNKYPRVHWHGVIKLKNPPEFFSRGLAELRHYSVDIDTIKDTGVWYRYCQKFIKQYREYKQYSIKHELEDDDVHNLLYRAD